MNPIGEAQRRITLPPLQTNFSNKPTQHRHRPRPEEISLPEQSRLQPSKHRAIDQEAEEAIAQTNSKLKRRSSKLFSLFYRNKLAEVGAVQEKLGIQWEGDETTETPVMRDAGVSCVAGPARLLQDNEHALVPDSPTIPLHPRASKRALRHKSSFKRDTTTKTPSIWNPPPLFQAYPQAVKYATLLSPTLPAETILRLNNERNAMKRVSSTPNNNSIRNGGQKDKKLKKATASEMVLKCEWTNKVYILVTSGYLLQYAGQGALDQLPEKILPLRKESAAFASDAIPGKHYVLQVSQTFDEDGAVDQELSRSMFKKFGLKSEMRSSTSSFLLVLANPEDMSDWLVAVRKKIQDLGGKEYRPDVLQRQPTEPSSPLLQQRPSHRYLVKRDPNQFSEKSWEPPLDVSFDDTVKTHSRPVIETDTQASSTMKRQSIATQKSNDSRYISNTTASIDQVHLDQLRESPRQSYASTGAKTSATSRGSSPGPSPLKDNHETAERTFRIPSIASIESGAGRVPMQNLPEHRTADRNSLQPTPRPSSRPVSTYTFPSLGGPNFSVPNYSKRYSTTSNSPSLSGTAPLKTHSPPIPPHVTKGATYQSTRRTSTLSELQAPHLKSSPRASKRVSPTDPSPHLNLLPNLLNSSDRSLKSDNDRRFSRRISSLEYTREVSPLQLPKDSPSPHPPPTTALPAIPAGDQLRSYPPGPRQPNALRDTSSIELSSHPPPAPPPLTALPAIPIEHSLQPSSDQYTSQGCAKTETPRKRRLHQSTNTKVSDGPVPAHQPPLQTAFKPALEDTQPRPPLNGLSPPRPSRAPPPPPVPPMSTPPQIQTRKSMPRIGWGREPPPVYAPVHSKCRVSMATPVSSTQQEAVPHSFIPPIQVSSNRKSRGSLDGPWDPSYGTPGKMFLDFNTS